MMCDFKRHTERVGLKIHTENTKIPSNQNSNTRVEVAFRTSKSLNCTNEKEVQEEDTETQRRKLIRGPQIPCWIGTHSRMKWRLAMRIASLPDKPWTKKTAKWNPGLAPKHQTNRPVERPKKRWEDEINEFLKPEETEETKGNETKNNDTWIKVAKKKNRKMESNGK